MSAAEGAGAALGVARRPMEPIRRPARPLIRGGGMGISHKGFEEQVLALLGSLNGVARRLTSNPADAEDLVAETVVRAWRARDSLENEAAFRAWIFRILHNTFVSELRRAGARPRLESFECDEAEEDEVQFSIFEQMHQPFLLWFSNPEQEYLDKLLREDLERALASLPQHHRVVVILSDLEELSYGEIAEALGIPVGTVRSRLARARGALQKILWQQAREYGLNAVPAALREADEGCAGAPRQATAEATGRKVKGPIR
jgi:RNA polymerase sigma-70 factor (ECF subfamily)